MCSRVTSSGVPVAIPEVSVIARRAVNGPAVDMAFKRDEPAFHDHGYLVGSGHH
jgi:hypothetical protein